MPAKKKSKSKRRTVTRKFDARPDTADFRDRIFVPTLVEVPIELPLALYVKTKPVILDQGSEGACTGFGLAACANYLLRTRKIVPDSKPVSPKMLYELAKRYDEWSGEDYDGSSARGAMKGWHKHGVCGQDFWPNDGGKRLSAKRAANAAARPLGAYFRVDHTDIVAMHAAMAEVGILYATGMVHAGWDNVGKDGVIRRYKRIKGGHAFAIVGYDSEGFWIQNSWGDKWGKKGYAHLSYSDWLENGMDIWVARLGAPVQTDIDGTATFGQAGAITGRVSAVALRPHVISIGNDGQLRKSGPFGNDLDDIKEIINTELPRVTESWSKKRILLYAHGGLVGEKNALQRVENYLPALLDARIYPIAFIWKTDFWTTLKNILKDAFSRRRAEGVLDDTKDFVLNRIDDALEPLARALTGKAQWDEMKENGIRSTTSVDGGARHVADLLAELAASDSRVEFHVAGHSAGSIFQAPLVQYLATEGEIKRGPLKGETGLGLPIETCTLWAPACTVRLFKRTYLEVFNARQIKKFALFNLTGRAEKDDHCARIYNKSLLYLVSNAFESKPRIPLFRDGEPILGMHKFVRKDKALKELFRKRAADYVRAPNREEEGTPDASTASSHGDFDDDVPTVKALLARISAKQKSQAKLNFPRSSSSAKDVRARYR